MTVNRRSATRHDLTIEVTVRLSDPGSSPEPIETSIQNLSLSGAFLVLEKRLSIGARMSMRFRIATHDRPIETEAVVRWSDDQGVGVQFDGLRAAEVWALGKLFEKPS